MGLGGIIAKVLALVEAVLDQFVDLSTYQVTSECGSIIGYNATTNGCGDAIATQIADLTYMGLALVSDILAGLAANIY